MLIDSTPLSLTGKLAISGAQETETFYEVFEKIAKGELKA